MRGVIYEMLKTTLWVSYEISISLTSYFDEKTRKHIAHGVNILQSFHMIMETFLE